jgi:hypothetical protein
VTATVQPCSTSPITFACGTRASLKNTSLKVAPPVISFSGRTSMPGWCMSITKYVIPACLGTSTFVRAMRMPHFENWAPEVQTFWPLTTHSSPSRTARVCRPARSEPAPGSLNSWHHTSRPLTMSGRNRSRCSSVPCSTIVGPAIITPMPDGGPNAPARRRSSWTTAASSVPRPLPNHRWGQVGYAQPERA